jgi:ketosteroid isomerase-like protein
VAVEARGRGRLAGGPEYRSTYAFFVEVERGKVRALREYMDSLAVSRLLSA